ncbi:dnaJ homolog subfamily C member 1 [Lethenteron reissneri]|uniref:dnaJ homolog subfamily C member 1 n=1 Tax=Lethenteron reissneri TaxID=7753 RepID=UPI002AB611B7|nr:dnaJ homolog subfamily C member 1 [Lethenteron reissneri]
MRASGPPWGPNGLGLMLLLPLVALGPMLTCVAAWDATDMELFDLVEEVQRNFYDVLGIDQAAPPSEIRKAYRRMSLLLHPDKNKQDNAEMLFRQLVAIYDVLKDEDKRGRYDIVLQNGLPDWRDTVFYIRRVRKMGLTEFSLLLFLILTVGHYLVAWSVYLERRFELQEVFTKRRKEKKRKFNKSSEMEEDIIETLPEEVRRLLVKPTLSDLLPCIFCRQFLLLLRSLPSLYQDCVHCYQSWKKRKYEAEAPCQSKDVTEEKRQPRQRRSRLEAIPELGSKEGILGGLRAPLPLDAPALEDLERQLDDWLQEKPTEHRHKDQEWTEEDGSRLARLMVKFPGGTPGRWERIANELGRSVAQVTTKAKQVKESITHTAGLTKLSTLKSVPLATLAEETAPNYEYHTEADMWRTEGSSGNSEKLSDGEPGEGDRDEGGQEAAGKRDGGGRRRRLKGGNPAERAAPPSDGASAERQRGRRQRDFLEEEDDDAEEERPGRSGEPVPGGVQSAGGSAEGGPAWSQNQQKLLELALQQFPRGTAERWEKIAKCVPGKTKDDCTNRYKLLAELVKKRKQQN